MCGFHLGVSQDRLVTVEDLEAVVIHLSKEMSVLVKATVDARLDRLGTLGPLFVDEFMERLNTAVGEMVAAHVSSSSGARLGIQGIYCLLVQRSALEVSALSVAKCGEVREREASSVVPSAFGERGSTVSLVKVVEDRQDLVKTHKTM